MVWLESDNDAWEITPDSWSEVSHDDAKRIPSGIRRRSRGSAQNKGEHGNGSFLNEAESICGEEYEPIEREIPREAYKTKEHYYEADASDIRNANSQPKSNQSW